MLVDAVNFTTNLLSSRIPNTFRVVHTSLRQICYYGMAAAFLSLPLDVINTLHDHNNITGHLPLCKAELLLQLYPLYDGGGGDSYNPQQNQACAPLYRHLSFPSIPRGQAPLLGFIRNKFT